MDPLTGTGAADTARVVVAYDIADDADRARAADQLLDFLGRVEYLLFDAWIPPARVGELWQCVAPHVRPATDRAFFIRLCDASALEAVDIGRGPGADPPGTSWMV